MKQRTGLFFLFFLVSLCLGQAWPARAMAAGPGPDLGAGIIDKTFFVVEHARGKEAEKDYHGYFKADGDFEIKFSPRHAKSGQWTLDDKGILCITTIRHKSNKTSFKMTRCGKLVPARTGIYHWYDGKGELRATFTLQGDGDRLP